MNANKVSLVVSTRDVINLLSYMERQTMADGKIGETIIIDFDVFTSKKSGEPMIHTHECVDASTNNCPFNRV